MHEAFMKRLEAKMGKAGLLPIKKQAELSTRILRQRLETILPWAMRKSGMDFWIVASREGCKDPMLKTLYPWDMYDARRIGILAFHYDKEKDTVRKMVIGPFSQEMEGIYERIQEPGETIWQTIARIVKEINPSKIAINRNHINGCCDGLSSTLYENIKDALGENAVKLCDGEPLTVYWLQRITPLELEIMKALVNITHDIIDYSFSRKFIKVGVTTTTDIEWFMRDVINRLGYLYWFGPDIDLQRKGSDVPRMFNEVILPGDLIHCDVGINGIYVQLHTDVQRVGYILKDGEKEAPKELSALFAKGNRLQDIVRENIRVCTTGNDVLLKSIETAKSEGIKPMIYTHPLGTFGHGVGPIIGLYDNQSYIHGAGERTIEDKTCYALELNVSDNIRVWNNQLVFMYLEEDIIKDGEVYFINGRQERLIII
ncbi:M24 family metallopeptidase [Lutispora thermophila]|uniref:Metallopeptidase family M24 n=1 Tax=Lutispora thermophila DSM 19022 TaxID=1122184 RepID=A0A1M6GUM2_9FIRM|nr:M24 family metallopeptidase [Lutispora thermophila]SHJ13637.1 Metallopeptidase family M24 [Lutispora thermophila DSM 19022]